MKKRALHLREGRVMRLGAVLALLLRFALVGDGGLRGGYLRYCFALPWLATAACAAAIASASPR